MTGKGEPWDTKEEGSGRYTRSSILGSRSRRWFTLFPDKILMICATDFNQIFMKPKKVRSL